jgi:hypothetical protein
VKKSGLSAEKRRWERQAETSEEEVRTGVSGDESGKVSRGHLALDISSPSISSSSLPTTGRSRARFPESGESSRRRVLRLPN